MIRPAPMDVAGLIQRLRDKVPFTLSRWGDGEWRSALGKKGGTNCDGHQFYAKMGDELAAVLKSKPPYLLGLQRLALRLYGKQIERFIEANGLGDLSWIDADGLHREAQTVGGKMKDLCEALGTRRVIVIGPPHLTALKLFPIDHFVLIPPKNCYKEVDSVVEKTLLATATSSDPAVVSVSASMPAEIIIDRLYQCAGRTHTFIDFGSLWDQYVGVKSRKYMQKGLIDPIEPAPR